MHQDAPNSSPDLQLPAAADAPRDPSQPQPSTPSVATPPAPTFTRARAARLSRQDYAREVSAAIDDAIANSVARGNIVSRDEVAQNPLRRRATVDSDIGAGRNHGTPHSALDILPAGPIYASVGGEVVFRGWWNNLAGETIVIRDDRGTPDQRDDRYWFYAHNVEGSSNHLNVGDIVQQGDRIGDVGSTGNANRYPVLHLTVRVFGERADTGSAMRELAEYNPSRITEDAPSPYMYASATDNASLPMVQPVIYRFGDFNRPIVAPINGRSDYRRGDTIDWVPNPGPAPVVEPLTPPPLIIPVMPVIPPGITGGEDVLEQTGPGSVPSGPVITPIGVPPR